MICAIVSFQSCFCLLYRASPSLAAKNIISLILVLTIRWCPCVESSFVLLEERVCYDQCVLFNKTLLENVSLCPTLFCTPRPNLPVTPGVSWLPIPYNWKRPWCWERLRAGGEGDDRGWDGWMTSPTPWTWVCVTPGVGDGQGGLECWGSRGHKESDTTEWMNWTELMPQWELQVRQIRIKPNASI